MLLYKVKGEGTGLGRPWHVIVLNDDHNTFEGVAFALSHTLPGVSYERGLEIADVDADEGIVRVTGKGGKDRVVPLGGAATSALRRYLGEGRPALGTTRGTRLFVSVRGRPLGLHEVPVDIVIADLVTAGVWMIGSATNPRSIAFVIVLAVGAFAMYQVVDHVRTRVDIWLDPFADPSGAGYQVVQSLYAFARGGLVGTGLGAGLPLISGRLPIPAIQTDFPLAALGEELGLVGIMAILGIYLVVIERGLRIGAAARDDFRALLATGRGTRRAPTGCTSPRSATRLRAP